MMYSKISVVALLGMSTVAATNTAIISGAIETKPADETIISNENTIIEETFIDNSRVEHNGDANSNDDNNNIVGRNYNEKNDKRNLDEITPPTLWPTYAPTPLTKAPATPIPTYSPTQLPTTTTSPPTPSPPTPSPTVTSTIRSPTSAPTPSPSISFIMTAFPVGSPIISSPTPYPTWKPVSEDGGFVQWTAFPTAYWRRRNERNLRDTIDQGED